MSGPRIFDLQIALAAFEGGATELWTHDGAFVTVPGLRVFDPFGLAPTRPSVRLPSVDDWAV